MRAYKRPTHEDDIPVGYCSACGIYGDAIIVDYGIGMNEFRGSVSIDEDLQWVSPCCEEEMQGHPLIESDE